LSAVKNNVINIENTRWLDACAAPGGKTSYLWERLPDTAEIVAVEFDVHRIQRLKNTLQRIDATSVQVIQGDATRPDTWWDGKKFDAILVDAPCSGSGVIRRHPDIKWLRQPNDLITLAQQQNTMLEKLWPLLLPDGYLLYATCSTFRVENDLVILNFTKNYSDVEIISIDVSSSEIPSMIKTDIGIQIFPSTYFIDNPLSCQAQNSFPLGAQQVKPAQHTLFINEERYVGMVSEWRTKCFANDILLENYSVAGPVMPSGDGFYYCLLRKKI
ncbi:MAG: methyltransferase domain-containing protein, partial [Pseudomonadota bacterium]